MKKLKCIRDAIINWLCVNGVIFFFWGLLSYIEVISKNINPNPIYSKWNLLMLIFK